MFDKQVIGKEENLLNRENHNFGNHTITENNAYK